MIDDITLALILTKFQQICAKRTSGVFSVSRDPEKEGSLIWNTASGTFRGAVWEEGDRLVFRVGKQELVIPVRTFLGTLHQ